MAVVVTSNPVAGIKSFSIGPIKMELASFTAEALDTSVEVTAQNLSQVDFVIVAGQPLAAQPVISGTTVTITVPSAGAKAGQVLLLGK